LHIFKKEIVAGKFGMIFVLSQNLIGAKKRKPGLPITVTPGWFEVD
jgi:hypothetical protein